ncbi:hypothetical protein DPMN_113485 [Dreissena polymorpha]|uniref:Uncharacterized protein n=1 Tax=Dreissena polymorpha TaxID=45954 RepID=A0A9D4QR16_DREPO|nr:hypothetical protein DPMN_113485 [Dreissena polymorpha]
MRLGPRFLPLPSGSSGWSPLLGGPLPESGCTSARCLCSRSLGATISYCPGYI